MGQAFDRDGNVLGEAEGETRREVLDKLEMMHPTAEEIRIKAFKDRLEAVTAQTHRVEQFFRFDHLPPHLQAVSQPFAELATHVITTLPHNPERTVALRKLLEARDCAVRALLYREG